VNRMWVPDGYDTDGTSPAGRYRALTSPASALYDTARSSRGGCPVAAAVAG
jgi:hypothetical protein